MIFLAPFDWKRWDLTLGNLPYVILFSPAPFVVPGGLDAAFESHLRAFGGLPFDFPM